MVKFATSKNLAGIGSILLFLSFLFNSFSAAHFLPFLFIGCIIGICGMVSILIGMKGLAEHYREDKIYKKARMGAIFSIIGYAVLPIMLLLVLQYYFSLNTNDDVFAAMWFGRAPLVLLTNVVSYAFMLLMAICFRQSFNWLADRSGKRLFRTVSTAMLIGVIVTFVLYIGAYVSALLPITSATEFVSLFILSSIFSSFFAEAAFIILAVLFFTLKTNPNTTSYNYPPPPVT
jgi:uncharacterized membrane protein